MSGKEHVSDAGALFPRTEFKQLLGMRHLFCLSSLSYVFEICIWPFTNETAKSHLHYCW